MRCSRRKSCYLSLLERYDDAPIVIVSHADQDHYNLVPEALGAIGGDAGRAAGVIFLGGERENYRQDNFELWLRDQEQRGVAVEAGLGRFSPFFNGNPLAAAGIACSSSSPILDGAQIANTRAKA